MSLSALAGLGLALAASEAAAASFRLDWDASESPDTTRYRIYRADNPAGPFTLLKTTTALTATVEVPLGERRCFRLRSVDDLGQAGDLSVYWCWTVTGEGGP